MSHEWDPDGEFYRKLSEEDDELAAVVKARGCPCGGRLHRADYPRKARGIPPEVEAAYSRRRSFCCDREGCRKRVTPRSLRFLGRRVYVGAVVMLCAARQVGSKSEPLQVPGRTVRRWVRWFQEQMPRRSFWQAARGRLMPPARQDELPRSLLERFTGAVSDRLQAALRFLSPLGTSLDGRVF